MLELMAGGRQTADTARAHANEALTDAHPRARRGAGSLPPGPQAVFALQRAAGNAAVNALMAGRMRFPGDQAVADIDGALRELRRDEPAIDTVEKGLKAAKATGVPVDLEGMRPPPSALAVTTTGFGPGAVAAKKPVPPPKKVPAVSPLGRAGAKKAAPGGGKGKGAAKPPTEGGSGVGAAQATAAAPLSADALLQPPVPPSPVRPGDDPAFTAVTGKVKATAKEKRAHPPAAAKAKEAQDAALPPAGDIGSQAKTAKADTMNAQQPGTFDKKAFITAVKTAIEAKSPKTLTEADNYKSSGKAGEVKAEVKGLVTEGKEGQTKDIKGATDAPPDQSKALPKQVTPMGPEPPGQAVPIPATGAVPKPAPAEQLNLAAGKHQADTELADADVSEEQLAESNEPEFESALADKKAAAAHADTAPGEFRQQEAQVIQQGKADAAAETADGVSGMQSSKAGALAKLVADKGKAKTKDEAKRAEVTTKIEGIFNATEGAVKKILDGIDPLVEKEFAAGEADARSVFENYVAAKMSAFKKDRYGGWLGPFRWARDKIKGMPPKVNEFYVAGRELYLQKMDKVIAKVADIVGDNLKAAKLRIAAGRNEITAYVKSLPKDLKKVGAEATKDINDRFSELESDVDAKQEALVDTLATKYVEARKGLDERIEELQAANKGLIDKAIGAIKAIINTIRELAAMLKNVLARVAGVVGQIIKSPVKFLGNLIAGVKGGILKFKEDFLGHLRRGLMSWLFGALAEGGIELPKSFDPKGIIGFLASIFGLTWANIRNRIVKQIGEKAMGAVEKGVEIFKIISGPDGVGGVWQMLLEKLGNIKDLIFDKVKDFVQDRIITAGISWLIGLLNPAGAFIKACKLIYDVVMFFVNNASRIAKFVDTILDSVADIVRGNIGGVVNKINDVLGQMVPIIIGFLASVIGLGNVGAKVREIVQKLQKPVNQAIDFVIKTGLKLAGPIIRGLKGVSSKVKAKVAAGKAWVKGKAEAGKEWVKTKAKAAGTKIKDRFTRRGAKSPEETPPPPARDADEALDRAGRELPGKYQTLLGAGPSRADVLSQGERWRAAYGLRELRFSESGAAAVVVARTTAREVAHAVVAANNQGALSQMIREVAMSLLNDLAVVRQVFQIMAERQAGRGRTPDDPRATQSSAGETAAIMWETRNPSWRNPEHLNLGGEAISERQTGMRPGQIETSFQGSPFGNRGNYGAIKEGLDALRARTGASEAEIIQGIEALTSGRPMPPVLAAHPDATSYLARVARLWYQVEPGRNPSSLITGPMAAAVVSGNASATRTATSAIPGRYNPMAIKDAGLAARGAGLAIGTPVPSRARGGEADDPLARAFLAKEERLMVAYLTTLIQSRKLVFADDGQLRHFIQHELREYLTQEIGALMTRVHQP